jgi:hypothetical protein
VLVVVKPRTAIGQLYGDAGGHDLTLKINDEFIGIPLSVLHAIANWNRGRNSGQEGTGLKDTQFADVVTPLLEPQ